MTSYRAMGDRGREAALETNARFRLRRITGVQQVDRPFGLIPGHTLPWTEFIGECGHIVDAHQGAQRSWDVKRIAQGKRKRCHQCPIDPVTDK